MPHSSGVEISRHAHMRELRIQHEGRPYRVLYAFDPRRAAMLLIGGDKLGNDRWYEEHVPLADAIYDRHLRSWRMNRGKANPEQERRAEKWHGTTKNFKH